MSDARWRVDLRRAERLIEMTVTELDKERPEVATDLHNAVLAPLRGILVRYDDHS